MPGNGDLLNWRFEKSGFSGYKASDVDSFMAEVASRITKTDREVAELRRKLEAAEKRLKEYQSQEDSLKNTLLSAQRLADRIVKEAQENADAALAAARGKADAITREAKVKAENLLGCTRSEIDLRRGEADRIKSEVSQFKLDMMRLYRKHLELINELPSEPAGAPAAREAPQEQGSGEAPAQECDAPPAEQRAPEQERQAPQSREQPLPEPAAQEPLAEPEISAPGPEKANASEEEDGTEQAMAETAAQSVKLNLRYNETTGEYEPLGAENGFSAMPGEGIRFGSGYSIRGDEFDNGGRRGRRK